MTFHGTRLRSWTNFSLDSVEMWRTLCWPCLIPQPWVKQSHKLCIVIINFLNVNNKSVANRRQHWSNSHHPCCKHMVSAPKDDPMQINETWFKPFIEHEKKHQHLNNLCLYYGEPSHIISVCLNKCVQHARHTITSTTT